MDNGTRISNMNLHWKPKDSMGWYDLINKDIYQHWVGTQYIMSVSRSKGKKWQIITGRGTKYLLPTERSTITANTVKEAKEKTEDLLAVLILEGAIDI